MNYTNTPVASSVLQGLTLGNFADKYKQEISALIKNLRAFCNQTLDLEGGHIYSDEEVTSNHIVQLRKTSLLKEILMNCGYGLDIETTLFIDNYHPSEHILDVVDYIKMAALQGLSFDNVFFEAEMSSAAELHIEDLKQAGFTKIHNGNLSLNTGEHLIKADSSLSCGILDATLSSEKLKRTSAGVIVLPNEYRGEQKNMKAILKALLKAGGDPSVNLFHSFFTKP